MEATATILHTIPEASERLRLSRGTVYRLMRLGKIEVVRIGGRTFIDEAEIVRLIEEGRQRRGGSECP